MKNKKLLRWIFVFFIAGIYLPYLPLCIFIKTNRYSSPTKFLSKLCQCSKIKKNISEVLMIIVECKVMASSHLAYNLIGYLQSQHFSISKFIQYINEEY